ncbi:Gfo/Idh/MocA family protein [Lapidilactobacillus bayanensis]|uniref:Gfo/Idh/MocA family protein n=1 Tax=Lapidilactobacillus bayanensis TaxID=2485998 RepID=UPI000F780093|nr:Gfo/Idh/MocA family oxidoreductase [Lapidilactobacillus bayanensis]
MLKIGIIGCGVIANTHAKIYQMLEKDMDIKLVACCDIDIDRGQEFARRYQLCYYQDYHELLDSNIDLVSICTPHYLHKEMSVAALKRNINVLCEKPMALNSTEAEEVIQAIKASNARYTVCFQNRFNASSMALKSLIDEQKFGQLKGIKGVVTWHRDAHYYSQDTWRGTVDQEGGGVLINQAIHTIDLITWLTGLPQRLSGKVMTSLLKNVISVEDSAMVVATNKDVVIDFFATNCFSEDSEPEIDFDFEKAQVRLLTDKLLINNQEVAKSAGSNQYGKDYYGNGHPALIKAFIESIINEKDNKYLPIEDGINSLRLIDSVYRSNKTNDWVDL